MYQKDKNIATALLLYPGWNPRV